MLSTQTLLDLVTEEMFKQNPMGFPVPTGTGGDTCYTHWRVVKGGCWTDSTECDGDTVRVPCGDACCLGSYVVCAYDSTVISVTPNGATVVGDCDSLDPNCEPVCGQGESTFKSGDPDLGFLFHRHSQPAFQEGQSNVQEVQMIERTSNEADPDKLPQRESIETTQGMTTRVQSRQ